MGKTVWGVHARVLFVLVLHDVYFFSYCTSLTAQFSGNIYLPHHIFYRLIYIVKTCYCIEGTSKKILQKFLHTYQVSYIKCLNLKMVEKLGPFFLMQ